MDERTEPKKRGEKHVRDGGRSHRLPNRKYRNRKHLLPNEVEVLLETAKTHSRYPDRDYALILLMYRHGLRAVEAAMLEWKDIDLAQNTIYINRVKGSEATTHKLADDEREALLNLQQAVILQVFVNERGRSFLVAGKKAHQADQAPGISRVVERLGQGSGLGIKVHAHMLRHACGYDLCV
jgi:integrase